MVAKDATSPEVLIALGLLQAMEQKQSFLVPAFTEKVRKAYPGLHRQGIALDITFRPVLQGGFSSPEINEAIGDFRDANDMMSVGNGYVLSPQGIETCRSIVHVAERNQEEFRAIRTALNTN